MMDGEGLIAHPASALKGYKMTDKAKASAATEKAVAENSVLPALTDAQLKEARIDGAKEDVKENAKGIHKMLTDGNLPGEVASPKYVGMDEIMQFAHLIDLPIAELERVIDGEASYGIGEDKVAGLLELERSGKNRTDFVRVLCARLGVKSPTEVTKAGPDYTNDTTPITKL